MVSLTYGVLRSAKEETRDHMTATRREGGRVLARAWLPAGLRPC
jgi:hypothetical protein